MSSLLRPYLARVVTSSRRLQWRRALLERRRRRRGQPHTVTVFLRINDPYSYLLLQVLGELGQRYSLRYEFRTVLNLPQEMYPAPRLWEANASRDALFLADLYQLQFPPALPQSTPLRDAQFTAQLLHWELQPGYLENALALFMEYWRQGNPQDQSLVNQDIAKHFECYRQHLRANEKLLQRQGHYLSAMLYYGDEWYWGLDRLDHLERRLNTLMAPAVAEPIVRFDLGYRNFCRGPAAREPATGSPAKPIELYWSLRSPYSYIGLVRGRQLAQHYGLELVVKPVLPMLMRRMQVPRIKSNYILQDAKREAQKYQLQYGMIADPLGAGVERCYALYAYALEAGKGVAFLDSCARGVWAEGIRSDTEPGLRKLVERCGLDWQRAQSLLTDSSWRVWAQQNLVELYGNDLWGVPSFKYGASTVFGQDRLECIERAILSDLQTIDQQELQE